jgi:hypothetical protein
MFSTARLACARELLDRLRGPKERERQRHGERDQRVDTSGRFGFVELSSAGRITRHHSVGGAPLQDRVRPMAQLPLDDQALDHIDRRRHVLEALPMWLERDVAAYGVELTLKIVDTPALITKAPR